MMGKVMDILSLCHKVAYEPQMVAEGEGHYPKHRLPWGYRIGKMYTYRGTSNQIFPTLSQTGNAYAARATLFICEMPISHRMGK